MVGAYPSQRSDVFLAADRSTRSRDVNLILAWNSLTAERRQRLAVGSLLIAGSSRRGDIDTVDGLDMVLGIHAQGRLVERLGLRSLDAQRAALARCWLAMTNSISASAMRFRETHGQPANESVVGTHRYFYFPCCDGPRSEPSRGLAIVHHSAVLLGEIITVLGRDQLFDGEQERILARWPGPTPLMDDVEAPPSPPARSCVHCRRPDAEDRRRGRRAGMSVGEVRPRDEFSG